ncbi:MAG: CYTH domain-containing protein [archaeon]
MIRLGDTGGVFDTITARIKSRCDDHDSVRQILGSHGASHLGLDHQIDTYFDVPNAMFKIREGNIESFFVYVTSLDNQRCSVFFNTLPPNSRAVDYIPKELKTLVVVYKKRDIYQVDSVRFNLDDVRKLGRFVSIDVRDPSDKMPYSSMLEKLLLYSDMLKINIGDCITSSYASLMLGRLRS